jgi:phosphatidylglycerophosphate synthase
LKRIADSMARPLARLLHEALGLSPAQLTWASFWVSAAAAGAIVAGKVSLGLALMAAGQVLDGVDGAVARIYGLSSEQGHRLDTLLDRASESLIFLAFAVAGLAPMLHVLLAITAVLLVTTVCDRSGFDPGFKRVVLYFGAWVPWPTLFAIIFGANLAVYVIGLLIIDCQFQNRMDALGGDLDTIASRAARQEAAETAAPPPTTQPVLSEPPGR